jgi:hypothetical protein
MLADRLQFLSRINPGGNGRLFSGIRACPADDFEWLAGAADETAMVNLYTGYS